MWSGEQMVTERFFIEQPPGSDAGVVRLPRDESHHLRNVLRLDLGDAVTLFDGSGIDFIGRIAAFERDAAVVEIERREPSRREPPVAVTLAVALVKQAAMDQLVDACTQLGMARLIPMTTDRTVVRPKPGKLDRWRRIAIKACKQCGRSVVPAFDAPVTLDVVVQAASEYDTTAIGATPRAAAPSFGFHEFMKSENARVNPQSVLCLIGPEGGFTDAEKQAAIGAGCRPITLSRSILRTEVAAATAVALIAGAAGSRS
jgi:16S rRNA (uracil1498-N3)-methyltransferase